MQCNCEHPSYILNPAFRELICVHRNCFINGKRSTLFDFNSKNLYYSLKENQFTFFIHLLNKDNIDDFYISDCVTKRHYPLFLQVPCGKCEVCRSAKVNAFVERCKLETQMYNNKPLFLTLTYAPKYRKKSGVCLRDVQLFLKRLRINLVRQGRREKIRYVFVSEYGKPENSSLPHYHAILWNMCADSVQDFREVRKIIEKSWPYGFVCLRQVDPSNDKAFYYTTKYLSKDSIVPNGCNKTFMVSSNRCGGIGSAFYDRERRNVARFLNTSLKYVNKWNLRTYDVQFNRYALNRMLPTLSRSLPYSFKKRVRRFSLNYEYLKECGDCNVHVFDRTYDDLRFFHSYFYVPVLSNVLSSFIDAVPNTLYREMLDDEQFIRIVLDKGVKFFDDAIYYSDRRVSFLDKLFATVNEIDFESKSYKARLRRERAIQRLVL